MDCLLFLTQFCSIEKYFCLPTSMIPQAAFMYFEFVKAVDWLARFVLHFFFALLFAINNVP